jgi:hypothetical protein
MSGWLGLSVGGAVYAGTLTSLTVTRRFVPRVGLQELRQSMGRLVSAILGMAISLRMR